MSLLVRYAATPWALEGSVAESLSEILLRHDQGIKLDADQIAQAIGRPVSAGPIKTAYEVRNGVAIVPITGVIARFASQVNNGSQPQGTSTEAILQDVRKALADTDVKAILLAVDSPGGSVSGVKETADIIRQASAVKPMAAIFDDLGASAAYWIASQAGKLYASETAFVGSIGVYSVLVDRSKQAEKDGVRVVKVSSGPYKGAGVPGTEITDAQAKDAQSIVDQLAMMFFGAVGQARKLSGDALTAVTDGRVHLAKDAQRLGLIDGIRSLDQVIAELRAGATTGAPPRAVAASTTSIKGSHPMKFTAAFIAALIASYPAHATFVSEQVAKAEKDDSITPDGVKSAVLEKEIGALREQFATAKTASDAAIVAKDAEITRLKAAVTDAESKRDALAGIRSGAAKDPGADPAATGAKTTVDVEAQWRSAFASDAKLQETFSLGGIESYVAYMRAEGGKKK